LSDEVAVQALTKEAKLKEKFHMTIEEIEATQKN
jgi:hypothetical protein